MTLEPSTTLADLVTANPARARVLESLGLDYCCNGSRRLDDASAEAHLDVELVVDALGRVEGAPEVDWPSMPPAALADHIETTHHSYLHTEFARLSSLAAKVTEVHGERHPELADVARTYEELRAELEPHLRKEELALFPMIRELASATELPEFHCGSLRNPISAMLREHDRAGELLARLRVLTDDYHVPADGCTSYQMLYAALAELEADTHLHTHKENNVLFPAVLRLEDDLSRDTARSDADRPR